MKGRVAGQGGLSINGLIESYQVQAGENISAGDFVAFVNSKIVPSYNEYEYDWSSPSIGSEYVFNAGNTQYVSITALSSTQAIVAYKDYTNSHFGTACVLTISGSTITPGNEYVFNTGITSYVSITSLSSTQAVVTYQDESNNRYGTACVLTISGSTITPGSESIFNAGESTYNIVSSLSSTQAIVAYKDDTNSNYGTACVLTISGSTITPGNEYVFNTGLTYDLVVTTLSSTKAIVAYKDASNSNYGTACVLTISGSTITPGNEYVFNTDSISYTSITALSSTQAIVIYYDGGNSSGTACVLTISGSTITPGSESIFNAGVISQTSITALSSTQAIVAYRDSSNNFYGTVVVLTVSGSTITPGSKYVFNTGDTYDSAITLLSSTQAIVAYQDVSNSYYGTAVSLTGIENLLGAAIDGVAKQNGTGGETIDVFVPDL